MGRQVPVPGWTGLVFGSTSSVLGWSCQLLGSIGPVLGWTGPVIGSVLRWTGSALGLTGLVLSVCFYPCLVLVLFIGPFLLEMKFCTHFSLVLFCVETVG